MAEDRFASVTIDNFLLPHRIRDLRACFDRDGDFRPHYGLIDRPPPGSPSFSEVATNVETFEAAVDSDRLARELLLFGPLPGRMTSAGWVAHLRWTMLLRSHAMRAWLEAISGETLSGEVVQMPRKMRKGDFCRPHDDTGYGRRLCLLLYVDDGWKPGFGGRFQQMDGSFVAQSVEPLGNRLLIHRPRIDLIHQVEPFAPAADKWSRHTYSIWYSS